MTNNQKFQAWEMILVSAQIIHLVVALSFTYQDKYPQAVGLLVFSGMCIGLGKNQYPAIKFFNKIILGLAVVITFHWYSQ